ncbi:hypothetical protein MMC16_004785 [Acarospora aff. strigata]|nr:hypothetical protein [Acarospora aff. strigata]
MSPPRLSSDRINPDWGGAPDQPFVPTNRDRKKWRPFQQGRANRGPTNAPKAPRAMSGTLRKQQTYSPGPQTQFPYPRRAESGLPTMEVSRPGPLPADHPLKREMDELKATRKKRQLYWAGLIEDLGDDEWGNPANYDRQRWEEEERLADKKFEELAGQIKLAEMGFPLLASGDQDQSTRTSAEWGSDQGPTADAHRDRYSHDRGGTVRMHPRGRHSRDHSYRRSPGEGLYSRSKGPKPNPNTPPRKEVFWTQQKRASAVNKWMDQMGMNISRNQLSMEQSYMVGPAPSSSDHLATDDYHPERVGHFNDLRAVDSPNDHQVVVEQHKITDGPSWTILDELAFEETEREREEERLLLGQYQDEDRGARHTIETDAVSALTPSRTATLVKQSEKRLPRKRTTPFDSDPDLMGALMKGLSKEQVITPKPIQHNVPASSRETDANNETVGLTSRLVPTQHSSDRTSLHRQSLPQSSSTEPSPEMASNTSRMVNRPMSSSGEPKPLALSEADVTRQDHARPKVAADLIEGEETQIERLDMRNDITSDGSESELQPRPYSDCNDEDGFIRIDDTPRPSSPISVANATQAKPSASSSQNKTPPDFSALGLHYRNMLKVNDMFSPAGTLLPPEPGSVAARLRGLRGSYDEYSDIVRRGAAARWNKAANEGRFVVEGVSNWVDARIWLVDWRERLEM